MVVTGRDTATDAVNSSTQSELSVVGLVAAGGRLSVAFRGDLESPGLPAIGTIHSLKTDYQEYSEFSRLNLW